MNLVPILKNGKQNKTEYRKKHRERRNETQIINESMFCHIIKQGQLISVTLITTGVS